MPYPVVDPCKGVNRVIGPVELISNVRVKRMVLAEQVLRPLARVRIIPVSHWVCCFGLSLFLGDERMSLGRDIDPGCFGRDEDVAG